MNWRNGERGGGGGGDEEKENGMETSFSRQSEPAETIEKRSFNVWLFIVSG